MTIDRSQVKAVAHLARLTIDENDVETMTDTITQVLMVIDKMQSVDTSNTSPMSHPLDAVQRLREDQVTESDEREQLQRSAPYTEDGLFLVPRVIE
ncbi:MAG: Asp-tRNA(Asn)/Glu-tRNA(Gln) amidotransferase subunit GatC [Candidatus Endonucleobacter bathymodioli]|uniref:Aspartyl/glutamyl-tRNA(Asn/Gln) amidotransferase subunit C n=1 Tax=Candidatus Endonucleibacter bathymodioli TaxID=539814 RepID=A0AA90NVT7_9GAMM|nr:Asp-tRNA(Asn)/Glu-tRNA(Gln) amidotransferase subunit GatC [Candidatus Endonucleobacter bathymodioli]